MRRGQTIWIIEHNRYVTEATVLDSRAGFVVMELPTGAWIRLRNNRCYQAREAAEQYINSKRGCESTSVMQIKNCRTGYRMPQLH